MRSIHFDITDIVDYARNHEQVSGIQRVQVRLIRSVCQTCPDAEIFCTYWDPDHKQYIRISARALLSSPDFRANELLIKLGMLDANSRWPAKWMVKRALRRYEGNKQVRALRKLQIYALAAVHPVGLNAMGVRPPTRTVAAAPIDRTVLTHLPPDSSLVFLGANWHMAKLADIAREHKAAGGDVIQLIHDLIPITQPQYFTAGLVDSFRRFLEQSLTFVTRYACVSKWTAQDLAAYLKGTGSTAPILTLPLAHEFNGLPRNTCDSQPETKTVRELCTSGPFVLCVGTIEVRKNGLALLKAWETLARQRPDGLPKLVFVGKYGWKVDEFRQLLQGSELLQRHVVVLQNTSDRDLACLYQACLFTVYPSFYEGWGLPVGEAAWFGKLCVSSSRTSVPEVCGALMPYVDPDDISGLTLTIADLIQDGPARKRLENELRASPLRTWDIVAREFMAFAAENAPSLQHRSA